MLTALLAVSYWGQKDPIYVKHDNFSLLFNTSAMKETMTCSMHSQTHTLSIYAHVCKMTFSAAPTGSTVVQLVRTAVDSCLHFVYPTGWPQVSHQTEWQTKLRSKSFFFVVPACPALQQQQQQQQNVSTKKAYFTGCVVWVFIFV